MTLILFICRGNTCRSALAEAIARDAAKRAGCDATLEFESAGIAPEAIGAPADRRAMVCAGRHGLDLSRHQTRQAQPTLTAAASRIFALDRKVRDQLAEFATQRPVELLMDLVPELGVSDVADPWTGTVADYEVAFGLIEMAVARLVADTGAAMARAAVPKGS
jgi:protein-tyrosine phosphatase